MKLKIPVIYSQRNSEWASLLLGYNTSPAYTIGLYGCLISCYAMYLCAIGKQENPKTVNQKLKDNHGFTSGSGNLIWTAPGKVWGIEQIYLSSSYTGPVTDQGIAKIKSLLDEGKPLITEVDFNPATDGEEMHFVLITGYEGDTIYALDPWTGTEINLDVYGGPKRAIIQFRAYNITVPKQDTPQTPCDIQLIECKTQLEKEIKTKNETWQELQEVKDQFEGAQSTITTHENFMKALGGTLSCEPEAPKIMGAITELIGKEDRLIKAEKAVEESTSRISGLQNELQGLRQQIESLAIKNKELSSNVITSEEELTLTRGNLASCLSSQKFRPIIGFGNVYLCREVK